jgi:hypothetical protein
MRPADGMGACAARHADGQDTTRDPERKPRAVARLLPLEHWRQEHKRQEH